MADIRVLGSKAKSGDGIQGDKNKGGRKLEKVDKLKQQWKREMCDPYLDPAVKISAR
jgi:hypothetical protein